jgi:lipopolysaccharide export system permease protein
MRLLDRYLLRELAAPLAYCLAGFFIFWISYNLYSGLEGFQNKHLSFSEIALYYLVTSPEQIAFVMPISLLLGLLYALTNHARHNELTAMRAAGLGVWRLAAPYLAVGAIFTAMVFVVDETWAPRGLEKGANILLRHEAEGRPDRLWQPHVAFENQRENRLWDIQRFNLRTHEMERPFVITSEPGGGREEVYGSRGVYTNRAWVFMDATLIRYKSATNEIPEKSTNQFLVTGFAETPDLIQSEIRIRNLTAVQAAKRPQLSLSEINNYLSLHPRLDTHVEALVKTQLHGRLAAPFTCMVVVLIALPFGAASGRRNVFVGVASSVFICFAYFILQRVGLTLGTGGYLAPWLAAWLPNLAFAATGIVLVARLR